MPRGVQVFRQTAGVVDHNPLENMWLDPTTIVNSAKAAQEPPDLSDLIEGAIESWLTYFEQVTGIQLTNVVADLQNLFGDLNDGNSTAAVQAFFQLVTDIWHDLTDELTADLVSLFSGGTAGNWVTLFDDLGLSGLDGLGTFLNNIETYTNNAWNSIFGTATPSNTQKVLQTAVQDLDDAWTALFGSSSTPTTGSKVLQTAVQDLDNAWTALFGSSSAPTTSSAVQAAALPNIPAGTGPGQSGDLQTTLNNLVSWFMNNGSTVSGQTTTSSAQALQTIQNTVSGLSTKIQSQTTQTTGNSNSGQNFVVVFAAYSSWSTVPFSTSYGLIPGQVGSPGSGTFIISGGNAEWNEVNNGDVSGLCIFNNGGSGQAYTDTDYQELQAALAGLPNGAGSKNYAIMRANSAGTDYVYGVVYLSTGYTLNWEIGCYQSGTKHVWASGTNAPLNLNFTMYAGVGNNPNRYQGYSGSQLVFDHTNVSGDPGGVFPVGSTHRYWGFRSDTYNNGQVTPAPASYVGCADNTPATVPGSGIRMYRTNTASQSAGSIGMGTSFMVPYNFFDTIVENSSDMNQVTTSIGSADGTSFPIIQVANAGRYVVSMRVDVSAATCSSGAVSIAPAVARYNSSGTQQEIRLFPSPGFFVNGFGGQYDTGFFGATEVVSCQAGDMLAAAYVLSGGPSGAATGALSALSFTGEATGGHTYFEVTLANWSLN
jgi:hypothetical protein